MTAFFLEHAVLTYRNLKSSLINNLVNRIYRVFIPVRHDTDGNFHFLNIFYTLVLCSSF
uniref:Uncharacterized protein n=1 Tax=Macaca fascicularis TaxID=9541 RepID=A0A7N9CVK3_MACFA